MGWLDVEETASVSEVSLDLLSHLSRIRGTWINRVHRDPSAFIGGPGPRPLNKIYTLERCSADYRTFLQDTGPHKRKVRGLAACRVHTLFSCADFLSL